MAMEPLPPESDTVLPSVSARTCYTVHPMTTEVFEKQFADGQTLIVGRGVMVECHEFSDTVRQTVFL